MSDISEISKANRALATGQEPFSETDDQFNKSGTITAKDRNYELSMK